MLNKEVKSRILRNRAKKRYPKWKRKEISFFQSLKHPPVQWLLSRKHLVDAEPFNALDFQMRQEKLELAIDKFVAILKKRTTGRVKGKNLIPRDNQSKIFDIWEV